MHNSHAHILSLLVSLSLTHFCMGCLVALAERLLCSYQCGRKDGPSRLHGRTPDHLSVKIITPVKFFRFVHCRLHFIKCLVSFRYSRLEYVEERQKMASFKCTAKCLPNTCYSKSGLEQCLKFYKFTLVQISA